MIRPVSFWLGESVVRARFGLYQRSQCFANGMFSKKATKDMIFGIELWYDSILLEVNQLAEVWDWFKSRFIQNFLVFPSDQVRIS